MEDDECLAEFRVKKRDIPAQKHFKSQTGLAVISEAKPRAQKPGMMLTDEIKVSSRSFITLVIPRLQLFEFQVVFEV